MQFSFDLFRLLYIFKQILRCSFEIERNYIWNFITLKNVTTPSILYFFGNSVIKNLKRNDSPIIIPSHNNGHPYSNSRQLQT